MTATSSSSIVQIEIGDRVRSAFYSPERIRIGSAENVEISISLPGFAAGTLVADLRRVDGGYRLRDAQGEHLLLVGTENVIQGTTPPCIIRIGMTIPFGRHLLTGSLSEGGMAQVLSARLLGPRDMVFGERAIKLIHPDIRTHPQIEEMFLDEARIASEVRHPNVVRVFDVGVERGLLFLAMELVQGCTLRALLKKFQARGGAVPVALAAALMSQACRGLHAAHEARDAGGARMHVVHRDVSPHNLLCSTQGIVQVIDFGVARALGRLQRSAIGQFKGKPAYAAPEQVRGPTVDRRADIFAAAVVLYELCTAHQPFSRDTEYATLFAVLQDDARDMRALRRDIPRDLESLVHSAMAKDPAARPQSAAAFADQLDAFVRKTDARFLRPSEIAAFLTTEGIAIDDTRPSVLLEPPRILNSAAPPSMPPVAQAVKPPPIPPAALSAKTAAVLAPALHNEDTFILSRAPRDRPPDRATLHANQASPQDASPPPSPSDVRPPDRLVAESPPPGEPGIFLVPASDFAWQEIIPGVRVASVVLPIEALRRPRELPLNDIPGLLPTPLQVSLDHSSTPALVLEVAANAALQRGSQRAALYLNAAEPATRVDSYLINGDLPLIHLDLGHRRLKVRRLGLCACVSSAGIVATLRLPCAELGVTFAANALRLAVLYAPAEAGIAPSHAVCVRVG